MRQGTTHVFAVVGGLQVLSTEQTVADCHRLGAVIHINFPDQRQRFDHRRDKVIAQLVFIHTADPEAGAHVFSGITSTQGEVINNTAGERDGGNTDRKSTGEISSHTYYLFIIIFGVGSNVTECDRIKQNVNGQFAPG